jgi:hypothetical protein
MTETLHAYQRVRLRDFGQRLDHLPVGATTMFAAVPVALAVTIGRDCAHRTAGKSLHEINPG